MKKILKLITPLLAMLVLLTACGSEKTKVYTKSIDNQDLQVTIYYKGDSRVKKWASNLFLLAGILGCAPILIVILSKVLFLDQAILQFFDLVEEEVDIFLILFPPIVVVGVLSIISGLGYASSLKNFKE